MGRSDRETELPAYDQPQRMAYRDPLPNRNVGGQEDVEIQLSTPLCWAVGPSSQGALGFQQTSELFNSYYCTTPLLLSSFDFPRRYYKINFFQ